MVRTLLISIALFSLTSFSLDTFSQNATPLIIADEQIIKVGPDNPYGLNKAAGFAFTHQFHSPGSSYIKIHFVDFDLAPGDYVDVYNPLTGQSQIYALGGKVVDNGESMISDFWTGMIKGDRATVRLWSNGNSNYAGFKMDKVAYGYPESVIESMVTKSICGNDDKEQVICYDGTDMYTKSRAVCRLIIGGGSLCTGWLLGSEGHVMTNNHCISTASDAQNTDFQFNYEYINCNGTTAATDDIVASTSTRICFDGNLDYCLVELPVNPTGTYGYLSFRSTAPVIGERIYIPQHPGGRRKEIAVNDDQSVNGLAFIVDDGPNRVEYLCDTEGGSSGSPVIGFNDNLVVALHNTGGCENGGNQNNNIVNDMGTCLPLNAVGSVTLPPTADFSSDVSCLSVDFTDLSTNFPDSWNWDFGDGNMDTTANPTHTYAGFGTYDITLVATNNIGPDTIVSSITIGPDSAPITDTLVLCGMGTAELSADGAPLFDWYDAPLGGTLLGTGSTFVTGVISSDTTFYVGTSGACASLTLSPLVVDVVEEPDSVQNDLGCEGDALNLMAFGTGDFIWYDQASGGTALATGASYNTGPLTGSQTFYVAGLVGFPNEAVGPIDGTFGTGNYFDLDRRLVFDALDDVTIVSAWVDAGSSGNRTVEVFDGAVSIASTTVNIPQGQGRVNLNLSVPAGTDYQLAITSNLRDMYRNNGGVSYPYVSDHVEITASTAGTPQGFYYFFYDWEVEFDEPCESARIPVFADIQSAPLVSITLIGTLMDAGSGYASYQWYWNGNPVAGATSQTYDAPVGGNYYCVVTNSAGCEGTSNDVDVIINGLNDQIGEFEFAVWPNPSNDIFNVQVEDPGSMIRIYSSKGELVYNELATGSLNTINANKLVPGFYLLSVSSDDSVSSQRIIVE